MEIDRKALEAAVAAFRESTFDALTLDECRDAAEAAIRAYESAKQQSPAASAALDARTMEKIIGLADELDHIEGELMKANADMMIPATRSPGAIADDLRAIATPQPPASLGEEGIETIILPKEEYEAFVDALSAEAKANKKLRRLFREPAPTPALVEAAKEAKKELSDAARMLERSCPQHASACAAVVLKINAALEQAENGK